MDYEKKYKEALGKARQLCAYPTSKPFISDLQDIFPELKESEDEKIKQELIEYHKIQAFLDGNPNNNHVKFVSWLEKQGEPTDIPADAVLDSNKDGLIADTIRCKIEKQGEQKFAEWSEQDKENLYHVDALIKDSSLEVRRQEYLSNWLKSLRPQSIWKPSDEQMETLEDVVGSTSIYENDKEIMKSLLHDLKAL